MALDNNELAKRLAEAYGDWGVNRSTGPSFIDQYHNASLSLAELDRLKTAGELKSDEQFQTYNSFLKGQQGQAVAGGVIAGLGGLTNIATTATGLTKINDTTGYQNQIDDIGRIGATNYNSIDQLSADYARLATAQPQFEYEDIRGMNTGQKLAGVGSAALSGATTGLQIGGPWGALIGGVIGAGAGIGGWLEGDKAARNEERRLKQNAIVANENANENLQAAGERMADYHFRSGISNIAKSGGQLRKQETIEQFASRVLRKPRQRSSSPSNRIVHQHCAGGTMIRFKK